LSPGAKLPSNIKPTFKGAPKPAGDPHGIKKSINSKISKDATNAKTTKPQKEAPKTISKPKLQPKTNTKPTAPKKVEPTKIVESKPDIKKVVVDEKKKDNSYEEDMSDDFEKISDHDDKVQEKPKVETKVEPKIEPKVEPKVVPKVVPKVEPKIEPKVEPKVEKPIAPEIIDSPKGILSNLILP
jgi:hypothetical protein